MRSAVNGPIWLLVCRSWIIPSIRGQLLGTLLNSVGGKVGFLIPFQSRFDSGQALYFAVQLLQIEEPALGGLGVP